MLSPHEQAAMNCLRVVRQESDVIGVALSFGKDSLAILDLCCRVFDNVHAAFCVRVKGLRVVDHWMNQVRNRWGVETTVYPHPQLSRNYRNHVFQPHWKGMKSVPEITDYDIENAFRKDRGVDWIAWGIRSGDSVQRAMKLKRCGGIDRKVGRVYPIRNWTQKQVLDYLKRRKIQQTPSCGRRERDGLDFHPGALAMLKRIPADWAKWTRDFPFCELQLVEARTDAVGHALGSDQLAEGSPAANTTDLTQTPIHPNG